jgi:predicted cation transporter
MAAHGYVGMSVTPEARTAFRTAIALVTGAARRPVGVSEGMIAMSKLVESHLTDLVTILNTETSEDTTK